MDDTNLVTILKALGDAKRFRMVQEIAAAGELSCGQVAERFSVTQPTISHHLKQLVDAGILTVRHDAQHHFISVNRALLGELSGLLPARLSAGVENGLRQPAVKARRRPPAAAARQTRTG